MAAIPKQRTRKLKHTPPGYSGVLMLYVRLRKVMGTGTTQMFNDRLSFEIRAD